MRAESTNRVKKRCRQGILFWNSAFSCEERVIYRPTYDI